MGATASTESTVITKRPNDYIIGLPPSNIFSGEEGGKYNERLMYASTPIMDIMPCRPSFGTTSGDSGLQIFHLRNAADEFKKVLKVCGFKKAESMKTPIKIAFSGGNQMGESWNNQYTDSMFQDAANVTSKLGQFRQMTGAASSGLAGGIENAIGRSSLGKIDGVPEALSKITSIENQIKSGVGTTTTDLIKLAEGSRVDFPMIWTGSSYSPTYNFNIKLFNPETTEQSYEDNILYPLAILLAFATPTSDSVYTYDFPFMCSIRCPGLFELPAAGITGIQVVKGGESNRIFYNQQPGCIDVTVDVQSLYSTMIACDNEEAEQKSDRERPTLKKYFDALRGHADYQSTTDLSDTSTDAETASGVPTESTAVDTNTTPTDRVPSDAADAAAQTEADGLETLTPPFDDEDPGAVTTNIDSANSASSTVLLDSADPGYVEEEAAAFRSGWISSEDPNYPAYQQWVADGQTGDPREYIITNATIEGGGDPNAFFATDPYYEECGLAGDQRLLNQDAAFEDFMSDKRGQFEAGWVYDDDEYKFAYDNWVADGRTGDPADYIMEYAQAQGSSLMPNNSNAAIDFIRTTDDYNNVIPTGSSGRSYDSYGSIFSCDQSVNAMGLSGSPFQTALRLLDSSMSTSHSSAGSVAISSDTLRAQLSINTVSGIGSSVDTLLSQINSLHSDLSSIRTTLSNTVHQEIGSATILSEVVDNYLSSASPTTAYPSSGTVQSAALALSVALGDSADINQLTASYETRVENIGTHDDSFRTAIRAIRELF